MLKEYDLKHKEEKSKSAFELIFDNYPSSIITGLKGLVRVM